MGPAVAAVRDGLVSRPGLFGRLGGAGRVTVVSAPPGSGKTLLLRSWIGEAGLAARAACVPVQGEERDPQRFWLSVLGALRDTAAGSKLIRPLTAAPDLDGWAVVERLLADLGRLKDRVWLMLADGPATWPPSTPRPDQRVGVAGRSSAIIMGSPRCAAAGSR